MLAELSANTTHNNQDRLLAQARQELQGMPQNKPQRPAAVCAAYPGPTAVEGVGPRGRAG